MSDRPGQDLRLLYQEIILDHYRRPRKRGRLEGEHLTIRKANPLCGDEITLHLRLEAGRIAEVAFEGSGCSISLAAASMMSDVLDGKSFVEVQALSRSFREMLHGLPGAAADPGLKHLRALAGVARYPARVRCAMLPWSALEEAIPPPIGEATEP